MHSPIYLSSSCYAMMRHMLATLAYRGGKALRGAPPEFAEFRPEPTLRTPAEILAHIGDLLDWALAMARSKPDWHDSKPLEWDREVGRFFAALRAFDDYLVSGRAFQVRPEQVFQGPIADAFTHVGQIAMLRRMAGAPVRGESYFRADIEAGKVGPEQTAPVKEFD